MSKHSNHQPENRGEPPESVHASPSPSIAEGAFEEECEALRQERDELKEKILRQAAEFENYKKRTLKERIEFEQSANRKLIAEFIPLVDNLDRAMKSAKTESNTETLVAGLDMAMSEAIEIFKKHHVAPIPAVGQAFDPRYHEALMAEDSDEVEQDTVVEVFEHGYTIGEQVLIPSKVKVARKKRSG